MWRRLWTYKKEEVFAPLFVPLLEEDALALQVGPVIYHTKNLIAWL